MRVKSYIKINFINLTVYHFINFWYNRTITKKENTMRLPAQVLNQLEAEQMELFEQVTPNQLEIQF